MRRRDRLARLWSRLARRGRALIGGARRPERGIVTHIVIFDGTMSRLDPGHETNAGLAWRLLTEGGPRAAQGVYYDHGIQWTDWRATLAVIAGHGLDTRIRLAYGWLASRHRPGDRIVLMGYSRGAYAARSLAGVIDRVGLLRAQAATERNVRQAWRHYESPPAPDTVAAFHAAHCHADAPIAAVGVWDTVRALGLRWPLIWRVMPQAQSHHDHSLGASVRHGFQALALDETRPAYAPVMWKRPARWDGAMEQVWFRGSHGDVGGQLKGFAAARPLSNIPLVWLLERLETCGVTLPEGWQDRFARDADAPSAGTWGGWGKLFLSRRRRVVGACPSERLHQSVTDPPAHVPDYLRDGSGGHDQTGG